MEALSSGLPVITTSGSGSHEVVKDGENGYIVPFGDISAMVRAFTDVLEKFDPNFSERPSKLDSRFDIQVAAEKYMRLYNEVARVRL